MKGKVVFFCPYPIGEAPSQRFRFEQYYSWLKENGFEIHILPFYSQRAWKILYQKKNNFLFAFSLLLMLFNRTIQMFTAVDADFVFIHREMAPFGPPIMEFVIAKVFRKKIIYDYDDAIWLTDESKESWFFKITRWRSKVSSICRWSYRVSAGNAYLADYARQFSKTVVINPTTIDTENVHNSQLHVRNAKQNIVIGWTGSHSTLKYLEQLDSVLKRLEEKYSGLEFWVIADAKPALNVHRFKFRPWSLKTEIADLRQFDIGIMPLPDDDWTKGKCGFKALQYMALGIPTVASPVGVNTTIISPGSTGYLASSDRDWENVLSTLIEQDDLRKTIGNAGRKTVEQSYSINSNKNLFLNLFRS